MVREYRQNRIDEKVAEFMSLPLKRLLELMDEYASSWDGKDSGIAEDRAGYATDIQKKIAELHELLEGLADTI